MTKTKWNLLYYCVTVILSQVGRYFDYFKRKGAPDLALANMKKQTIRFNQMAKISRLSFFNCAQAHWSIRE